MRPNRLSIATVLLLLALPILLGACTKKEPMSPEEKLLNVYRTKLRALKERETGSYADYMAAENRTFPADRKRVNALAEEINAKFDALSDAEKEKYQKKWRERFQPVVDEIYARTRRLVVRQTSELTPEEMARIKEFSIRRQAMEKSLPAVDLKPEFFQLPETDGAP